MKASSGAVLVQVGDLHIGAYWVALDPVQSLSATVDAVRQLDRGVDAVLALGDLAQHGSETEYRQAREELARLEAPVHVAMGNHDDRETLRRHHPPLLTGSPSWDRLALAGQSRRELSQTLKRHPQVHQILGAHLHRPLVAQFASRPVVIAPSTYVQFPLRAHATELEPTDEPPGYVVHLIADDGQLTSYFHTAIWHDLAG
jgi:predicted phosphodiesterase